MKVEKFVFNSFDENTYLVSDETKECIIIDPGCYSQDERDFFVAHIKGNGLVPKAIVNTHCHTDHILGVNYLKDVFDIPFAANNADQYLLDIARRQALTHGWVLDDRPIVIDIDCPDGKKFDFGNSTLKCASTPGHTPGGQVIYSESGKFMLTGDTLFKGTIGRTDLPGGDYDTLISSIRNTVMRFDSLYDVYPGHGDGTSIGVEAGGNPFIGIDD